MKKLGMLFCACLLLLTGCQSSNDGLAKAQEKIDQSNLSFKIPKLDGYEVNYVQLVGPPKESRERPSETSKRFLLLTPIIKVS
ncbi:hypothetical protein PghCCS26_11300 [Paenibacillus glycanilyticus]|uniref:Lipoprotein n=1 Tax=Paenibacillus glycanilyticus TaxID=126569 RepID=A0ABQ6NHG9_9BACL|nr:hypothetical protein PghCCS26_11300 [Paenibacillus glycanilyticus]